MFLGIDDTDSRTSGCTTYIGFQIAAHYSGKIGGFPRLVRLNPNLPYKTRGNGAVCLPLNRDKKNQTQIGSFDRKPIFASINIDESFDQQEIDDVLNYAKESISKFYVKNQENTNPGIVILKDKLPEKLYRMALEIDLCKDCVTKLLDEYSAFYEGVGNGRGIIGAASSIAWGGKRHTFELLSYRYPHALPTDDKVRRKIANIADEFESTFNNRDGETVCLFPKERTPVIYGIRGTNSADLLKIQKIIGEEYPEMTQDYLIYMTNQGTDDHIMPFSGDRMKEYSSYSITGRISKTPQRRTGGHTYFSLNTGKQMVECVVFEPSKMFRNAVDQLEINDLITVYGSYGKEHLKVEKIKILSRSTVYLRKSPVCRACGKTMHNDGKMTYQCSVCGSQSRPMYEEKRRGEIPTELEPPVFARRHLSMPWKLEGLKLEEP